MEDECVSRQPTNGTSVPNPNAFMRIKANIVFPTGYQPHWITLSTNTLRLDLVRPLAGMAEAGNALEHGSNTPAGAVGRSASVWLLGLAVVGLLALPLEARAKRCVWDGGTAGGNWTAAVNWINDDPPVEGDDLVFPASVDPRKTHAYNDYGAGFTFGSITIEHHDYYLNGNAIVLTRGIHVEYDWPLAYSPPTIELSVTLGASQTFAAREDSTLQLRGDLNLNGHTLTADGGTTRGKVKLNCDISGAGGLILTGGELELNGWRNPNTYTGTTHVKSGTLRLARQFGTGRLLAVPGPLIVGDGVGAVDTAVAEVALADQIGLGAITVNADGLLRFPSAVEEIGALTLVGGHVTISEYGTLTLTEGATTRGSSVTARIEGPLAFAGAAATFTVASGSASPDLRVSGGIRGATDLVKQGSGLVEFAAANPAWSGALTINQGGVRITDAAALGTTERGATVNGSGWLTLGGVAVFGEALALNGAGASGLGALQAWSADSAWAGVITLAADTAIYVAEGILLDLTGSIVGSGSVAKEGRGTLRFSGSAANTHTGDTFVNAGVLELNKAGANGAVPGTLHVGIDSGTAKSVIARNLRSTQCKGGVVVNKTGLYDLNGFSEAVDGLTLNLGGAVQTGEGTLSLGSGSTVMVHQSPGLATVATISGKLNVGSGSHVFNIERGMRYPDDPTDLVVDALVSGSASIVKTGGGEMELAAANTFSGSLTINAGSVRMTHASALGTTTGGTTVANDAQLLVVGTLAVGNEALTLNSSAAGALSASGGDSSWAGNLTLAADALISVATGKELDLRGAIGGTGGLTKEGDGELMFTGSAANTYAGATRVHAGTLLLSKSAVNGAVPGALFIGDGVGGPDSDVVFVADRAQIDDNASVTITNTGKLELSGILGTSETIGLLNGSGVVHLGSSELQVGKNVACTYAGTIQGAGSFTKRGTASVTLTGANTYTGRTTVKEGTLRVNGSQAASQVEVQSGAVLGGNGTVGPIVQLSGSVAPGASLANPLGRLACGGLVLSAASAQLDFELNGPTAGTGHDQLVVRGPVTLGGLGQPRIKVGYAPTEGDQFTIIDNDHAVGATYFAGLTEGATLTAIGPNPLKFRITYRGGSDRNDVVLTLIDTALEAESLAVLTGNGNGVMDPNECNTLNVVLRNRNAATVTGIQTILTTTTPGVWITQAESPYADLPPGETRTNLRPFQISLAPDFVCGTEVQLALAVTTAAHGQFTVQLRHTGGCEDGGGYCLPCPDQLIQGKLTLADPRTPYQLVQDGVASACEAPKPSCPGLNPVTLGPSYSYRTYTFQNGAADACVTVELLQESGGVYTVAYTNQFLPDGPCLNYWADAGRVGAARYGFQVGARAVFTVVVTGPPEMNYTLRVSGGSCQPWLNIAPTTDQRMVLRWPNFASDFHLDATNVVQGLRTCVPVPDPVSGIGRDYVCTNAMTSPARFYQLHKP
jgi:autotransporter-associated beta strand protein